MATAPQDHDIRGNVLPPPPPPLVGKEAAPRRSPGEEARTLVAAQTVGALGTLSEDGHPWASLAGYACLADGSPVLMVSHLAEHGRNLARDPRASLMVAHANREVDQLAHGRVTLAGTAESATGALEDEARGAFLDAIPAANAYAGFGDFTIWVLRVERVRWVGGYGRMDTVEATAYSAAGPDPTAQFAPAAIGHLNDDHADALLAMARALGGYPDALAARCSGIDRYGIDLELETPRGHAPTRVGFAAAVDRPDGLRAATVDLAKRARGEGR